MTLNDGQTILHYRVERRIGEGGMGVVYAAEDTRLGRRVALKVLSPETAGDAGRRARFEREARAVAALNHPNIVTLHSVEEADGICFLTMEYVDGVGLSHRLEREGLPLAKLLDWSLAIAEALVAAHRAGVVHRDLKPDNIMVTADGRIKVLDFGLAKLRETAGERSSTALATASITEEGRILGTVAYMSPEQAEGKPLDHRSDVFSFGVVLYELATGRRPFQGDTAISTISSILKDTPAPLQQVNSALPAQLGRIVRRCLAKAPEQRYQSTEDLRADLRELKEESATGELTAVQEGRGTRSTRFAAVGAVLGLVALAALAFSLWPRSGARHAPAGALPVSILMSRATTDGQVREAAISPDGRYVAYVRSDGNTRSLRLRQIATGDEVQVVAPAEAPLTSPAFSVDGDYLYYLTVEPNQINGWASRVSVLGGTPRRIVDEASTLAVAPDGLRLSLTVARPEQSYVRIVGADGGEPRDVSQRQGRDHYDTSPKWSPDGRSLAVVSHRYGEPQEIVLIDLEQKREQVLPVPALRSIMDLVWMPGGDGFLVAGSERPTNLGASPQIFALSLGGDLQPVTRDLNSYTHLSVTADGATVAAVQEERRSGIAVAAVRDGVPGELTELFPVTASRAGWNGIAWLSGDRLAHVMLQGDVSQIFVTDVSSKASRALTTGPFHQHPAASRDGRTLVVARADGTRNYLFRLDPETGREQKLTDGQFEAYPVVAPDGSWVAYSSALESSVKLLKVPGAGGPPVEVTQTMAWCRGASADGREALCFGELPSGEFAAMLIPLAGGEPRRVGVPSGTLFNFGPDGRSITYLTFREGANELWSLPPEGGEPRRLARFEGAEIADFAWSPDGRWLAVVKVTRSGDVVLLKRASS